MKVFVIGDTSEDLAYWTIKHYPGATLFINDNKSEFQYGSIGDADLDTIIQTLLLADKIIFYDHKVWSDNNIRTQTIYLLYQLATVYKKIVTNLNHLEVFNDKNELGFYNPNTSFPKAYNNIFSYTSANFIGIQDIRQIDSAQVWIAGCSYAHGVLLKQKEKYAQIVADHFNLPISWLSKPASSIEFAADQILRADIKQNDIVIWGITGINRMLWYDENCEAHGVTINTVDVILSDISRSERKDILSALSSTTRAGVAIKNVCQVETYLKKIGAHLILISHPELSLSVHYKILDRYLSSTKNYLNVYENSKQHDDSLVTRARADVNRDHLYIDTVEDQRHPGPFQNKKWAQKIITEIKNRKIV